MINNGVQDGLCWRKTGTLLYVYVCVHVCGYQQKDYLHFDSSNTYLFMCLNLDLLYCFKFLEVQHLVSEHF